MTGWSFGLTRWLFSNQENNRLARYSAGTGWLLTSRFPAEYLASINYYDSLALSGKSNL